MAKTLQFRRGTTAELSSVTGAVGELFVDTTKDTVVVMDGSTAGGSPLATEAYVGTAVSNLVDSAPGALDTLNELAAALGDDANFATTVTNGIASAGGYANSAYSKANTAQIHAEAAFAAANTSGGGGGASTGYFTFTANTANVATGNTAVFNTSGFETTTLASADFWQNSNLFYTGGPGNEEFPTESYLRVWENPAMGPNAELTAQALSVIATLSTLTAGTPLTVVTAVATYSGTVASIQTGNDPTIGDYINVFFVEDFGGGSGEYNQSFSFDTPISGQFTMDTDGTFITDTLLAGDLYVANNIITPVAGGSYGATVQPVVINGDLSVLGNVTVVGEATSDEYAVFSGISPAPLGEGTNYTVPSKNKKYIFLPTELGGDAYLVYLTLPSEVSIGDTLDFLITTNNYSTSLGVTVYVYPGTTNGTTDAIIGAVNPSTPISFISSSSQTPWGHTVKFVYIGNNKWIFTSISNNPYPLP